MREGIKYQRLVALKHSDRASFKEIYDQYHQVIYFYTLKLIRRHAWAEEATADVFIKLWEKRHIIDPHAPFTPFLYKIAKDIAYNTLRKIATDDRLKRKYLESFDTAHQKDGERILIETEALDTVHATVEKLPERRKAIFKLRYMEGLNNHTIAEQLGISVNTVREQLARARQFLREQRNLHETSLVFLLFFFL